MAKQPIKPNQPKHVPKTEPKTQPFRKIEPRPNPDKGAPRPPKRDK